MVTFVTLVTLVTFVTLLMLVLVLRMLVTLVVTRMPTATTGGALVTTAGAVPTGAGTMMPTRDPGGAGTKQPSGPIGRSPAITLTAAGRGAGAGPTPAGCITSRGGASMTQPATSSARQNRLIRMDRLLPQGDPTSDRTASLHIPDPSDQE